MNSRVLWAVFWIVFIIAIAFIVLGIKMEQP